MEHLTHWAGFLGAWMLVAGPIYQAALELGEEDIERDRMVQQLSERVQPPPAVSRWWLLLPPIYWVLHRLRAEKYQGMMVDAMNDQDYAALTHYINKAMGWIVVASGAALLALAETYALRADMEWPIAVFWILLFVMAGLSVAFTVTRLHRSEREIKARAAGSGARGTS